MPPITLSDEHLQTLRTGYNPVVLRSATVGAFGERHPAGLPYVKSFVDTLFAEEDLAAADRERCIIAILGGQKNSMALAVHVYWGLMEGLVPSEIAHVLSLCGGYQGIDAYASGLRVLEATCGMLAAAASAGATDSRQILGRILEVFHA